MTSRVWFLNGKEEEKKIAKREEREKESKRKNGLIYSGFTFQITTAAATLKTNTPTAAWRFKLGPVVVVVVVVIVDGVPAHC